MQFVVVVSFVDDAYISGEINRIKIEAKSEPAEELIKKLKKNSIMHLCFSCMLHLSNGTEIAGETKTQPC